MQYGLIGEKLSHSFSKEIHEALTDYTYELCEIARDHLTSFLKKREFRAINVTMPYKKEVIPHLDYVDDVANELQAVNVIVNRDGKLYGYNTDYFGMRDLILKSKIDISNKKILILGTGGTARTSTLVCKDLGATDIILVSRDEKAGAITYSEAYLLHNDAQIVINATPVGMYPNSYASPLDLNKFSNLLAVFDAVYNQIFWRCLMRFTIQSEHKSFLTRKNAVFMQRVGFICSCLKQYTRLSFSLIQGLMRIKLMKFIKKY